MWVVPAPCRQYRLNRFQPGRASWNDQANYGRSCANWSGTHPRITRLGARNRKSGKIRVDQHASRALVQEQRRIRSTRQCSGQRRNVAGHGKNLIVGEIVGHRVFRCLTGTAGSFLEAATLVCNIVRVPAGQARHGAVAAPLDAVTLGAGCRTPDRNPLTEVFPAASSRLCPDTGGGRDKPEQCLARAATSRQLRTGFSDHGRHHRMQSA